MTFKHLVHKEKFNHFAKLAKLLTKFSNCPALLVSSNFNNWKTIFYMKIISYKKLPRPFFSQNKVWNFLKKQVLIQAKYLQKYSLVSYPFQRVNVIDYCSGSRHCNHNQKFPSSDPSMCLAGLRDPTLLWSPKWILYQTL